MYLNIHVELREKRTRRSHIIAIQRRFNQIFMANQLSNTIPNSMDTQARQAYKRKVEAQIEKINARIDEFKAKADQAEADAKIKYNTLLEDLIAKRDATQSKLEELQNASESAWGELQKGAENAWQELDSAFQKAAQQF